jgi:MFS transporter, FSR family, fosmidomycin resistance protein
MSKLNNTIEKIRNNPLAFLRTLYHSAAHFSVDLFLAFFAPTLPVLVSQMNLLKVQAGILNLGLELTALSMPLIGRIADNRDIRKYMFLTPAITAVCMSSLTLIDDYYLLLAVLLVGGLSIYFYHAIGPADIGQVSDKSLGSILAVWNIAGQIGFMLGPLLITFILTNQLTKEIPYLILVGIALSVFLFFLGNKISVKKQVESKEEKASRKLDRAARQHIIRQFIPIVGISITNSLLRSSAYAYIPVYIVEKGGSLWMSGMSVSIYFGSGMIGNYVGGLLYDRIGSKWVTRISLVGFALSFVGVVFTPGLVQLIFIGVSGFFGFMLMPTLMAMLQKNNPQDRSLTNGLFLGFTYSITALGSVVMGFLLDHMGYQRAFLIAVGVGLISLVFTPLLVDEKASTNTAEA